MKPEPTIEVEGKEADAPFHEILKKVNSWGIKTYNRYRKQMQKGRA